MNGGTDSINSCFLFCPIAVVTLCVWGGEFFYREQEFSAVFFLPVFLCPVPFSSVLGEGGLSLAQNLHCCFFFSSSNLKEQLLRSLGQSTEAGRLYPLMCKKEEAHWVKQEF